MVVKSRYVQYDIEYQIVWTTKYGYKVLQGRVAERLREIIRQSCNSMNITIERGLISKGYIHLLISCPPNISVLKIVQQLKEESSRILLSEYKDLKRKFWGQYLWETGYFCRTVGEVTEEMIKDYIENHPSEYEENFKIIG